jgi:hypothetical protein
MDLPATTGNAAAGHMPERSSRRKGPLDGRLFLLLLLPSRATAGTRPPAARQMSRDLQGRARKLSCR